MPFKLNRSSVRLNAPGRFGVRLAGRARRREGGWDAMPARAGCMDRRSSWNAHLVLSEEITGSSPVRSTFDLAVVAHRVELLASNQRDGVRVPAAAPDGDSANGRPPGFSPGYGGSTPPSPAHAPVSPTGRGARPKPGRLGVRLPHGVPRRRSSSGRARSRVRPRYAGSSPRDGSLLRL